MNINNNIEGTEKTEKLMDAIGGIGDELILETERFRSEGERKRRLRRRRRLQTFAGTLAAAVLLGLIVAVPQTLRMGRSESSGGTNHAQYSNSDSAAPAAIESTTETAEWDIGVTESAAGDDFPSEGSYAVSEAAPESAEQEERDSEGADERTEGMAPAGSNATDGTATQGEKGEDVPAEEPLRETEDYPESLLELQERVSQAMADGELPFVTSSAILEEPLRLEVCVTTEDEALLDTLRALDPDGEWLVIVSGSGAVLE